MSEKKQIDLNQIEQIEGLTLTPEQVKQYCRIINERGWLRSQTLQEAAHEIDFAMGAAVLLYATGNQDKMPANWIFNAMRGVAIFNEPGGDA